MKPWPIVVVAVVAAAGVYAFMRADGPQEVTDDVVRAVGPDVTGTSLSARDVTFLTVAAQSGRAEVDLARLAQKNASAPPVVSVADRLEREHAQTNDQIGALAELKHVDFPNDAAGLPGPTDQHEATRERLSKMKGVAFERAWIEQLLDNHKMSIELFSKAESSEDADVKAFAARTLPVLRLHVEHLEEALKATQASR